MHKINKYTLVAVVVYNGMERFGIYSKMANVVWDIIAVTASF